MSTMTMQAQAPELFEIEVKKYVESTLNDVQKVHEWKVKNTKPLIKLDPTENADMMAMYESELRTQYIQNNMQAYMNAYFGENYASPLSTISVCDNGGFEQNFTHYQGFSGVFDSGSITCTPLSGGQPTVFIQRPLPSFREFEIVTQGIDPITGIQRVKFGNKALKINDPYNHSSGFVCRGDFGVNKVIKTFTVTPENKDFTVWYSVALENPTGHINTQPFISIKCDLAPTYDLCYDADFLECEDIYNQALCFFTNTMVEMDVLDWTCHRIKIPNSEIGNIATLEIMVADCGEGAHNGYAYIDGICEECTGSALGSISLPTGGLNSQGSIQYYSCEGGKVSICGTYNLPTVCGDWQLHTLAIPGYVINNLTIDTLNGTYCFDFPLSSFGNQNCIDIFAEIVFINGQTLMPPQLSNSINICKDKIGKYDIEAVVSECDPNDTPSFLSDDYYYVTLFIDDADFNGWTVQRQLLDPYQGESGLYTMTSGAGTQTIILGPFLIQEGCWDLIVNFNNCVLTEKICPPPFCSGCDAFDDILIGNVNCNPGPPDSWTFDIFVPGTGSFSYNGMTKLKGITNTIFVSSIQQSCLPITLANDFPNCIKELIICPPIPCSVNDCDMEVYPGKISCYITPMGTEFNVKLQTINSNLCYQIGGGPVQNVPLTGEIGNFIGGVEIRVFPCGNPLCFKMIYLPKPDCKNPNLEMSQGRISSSNNIVNLKIVPNPLISEYLTIKSDNIIENEIQFHIYNYSGKLIHSGFYSGLEQTIPFSHNNGFYILKYREKSGKSKYFKFVKCN